MMKQFGLNKYMIQFLSGLVKAVVSTKFRVSAVGLRTTYVFMLKYATEIKKQFSQRSLF
jgi:hypothetical protein